MKNYDVHFDVTVHVSKKVRAASLEDAIKRGAEIAHLDPTDARLVVIPKNVDYQWWDDTKLTGANES